MRERPRLPRTLLYDQQGSPLLGKHLLRHLVPITDFVPVARGTLPEQFVFGACRAADSYTGDGALIVPMTSRHACAIRNRGTSSPATYRFTNF